MRYPKFGTFPKISLLFGSLTLMTINLTAQIFSEEKYDRYDWSVEAGYAKTHFEAAKANPALGGNSSAEGVFLLGRAKSSLVYATFGKYSLNGSSNDFVLLGIEAPLVPFTKTFNRNFSTGILFSAISDYMRWKRPNDDNGKKLELSGFGLNVGGFVKSRFSDVEISSKIAVGYAYVVQYIGQENGDQFNAKFTANVIFPNITDYFGLSSTIFANYSKFDLETDDIDFLIMTYGLSVGVTF